MSNPVLVAQGLKKTYTSGPQAVTVWEDVDLTIDALREAHQSQHRTRPAAETPAHLLSYTEEE